jgi:hypothetical protein
VVSALAPLAASAAVFGAIVAATAFSENNPPTPAPTATTGTLTGKVPLCYGPGPDTNITPTLKVVAMQNGEVKATVTVPATIAAHSYRLTLPPGTYTARAGAWEALRAIVRAGETTAVDLRGGICGHQDR